MLRSKEHHKGHINSIWSKVHPILYKKKKKKLIYYGYPEMNNNTYNMDIINNSSGICY